jgi:D-alanine-D-alanine ligase
MKKLRILVLMHESCVPPESIEGVNDKEMAAWKTEYDVLAALHNMGHQTQPVGVGDELNVIREALREHRPHIVFNLLEEFRGLDTYVPYVLGYLELIHQSYTGCNPRGLMFATNKVLQRKILRYHRIPTPDFWLVPLGKRARRPRRMEFPLIVKSATEHGSVGIAQASVVYDDERLADRVEFVHQQLQTDALVEQFIEGRELYVGLLGNHRLESFPIWEMYFDNLPEGAPKIATSRVKWDYAYQQRVGLRTGPAEGLTEEQAAKIIRLCKRAYRALNQSGYARLDLRMTDDGRVVLIESNPNPQLAYGEDFAESAHASGLEYPQLLQRILQLGLRYHAGLE